jgi:ribonuclease P protein component
VLAPAQRLRRREEFTAALRTGRRAARGTLVVHLALPPSAHTGPDAAREGAAAARGEQTLPPARAGFIVPRTVGKAVVRNRVRRRLRHLVRERLATLPPGTLLVVRALPAAAEASYAQLGADLDGALAAARRRSREAVR